MKTSFLAAGPRRALAAILGVLLAAALGVVSATPALAHAALKRSDPEKNAKVESLERVELEFNQPVRLPTVILRGPGGETYHTGKPKVDGAVVTQDVADDLPAGSYTIAFRVVSEDGHPVEGEIPFKIVAPEPAETPSTPEEGEGASGEATPAATASAEPSAGPTGAAAGDAADDAADDAAGGAGSTAPASTEQGSGGMPVWVWMVVFGLAGIGIGMAISLRPKKTTGEDTTAAKDR